ncbi:helix-turn-helix transcriptional regulator [Halorubrum rubrum]|uniref:Helix-turn-helix transcriptional regulator n=1 Tax=Halorubrum rubrum TaxID=1126240 RepID=A0ABD5R2R3_9EURY|nr:MarR family transcriptional regulator [Halorubrum rubrum]
MIRIPSRPRSELLAIGIFVAAITVLVTQFITATPAAVAVGDESTRIGSLGWQFTLRDAALIAISSYAAGGSTIALLNGAESTSSTVADTERTDPSAQQSTDESSNELLQARREEWETVSERLTSNEELVYQMVLEADGVLPQSEIVDRTDLSKATVSRTLDSLEAKNLAERKRHGMGNTVLLT